MDSLVSIIMPNYNYSNFLQKSVESVLSQTYLNIELIIIDDCSSDDSVESVKNYFSDNRLQIIVNDQNRGVSYCRNKGIEVSKGSYIAFIDPDDYWVLNKIELQMILMKEKKANLCFSNITIIDEIGLIKKERKHNFNKYNYKKLLKRNFVAHSSLIVQKDLLKNFSYPEIKTNNALLIRLMRITKTNHLIHEDFAFLLNIFKQPIVKPTHIEESLVFYRTHQNSYSANHFKKLISLYSIFNENQHFNFFVSFYYTIRLAILATLKNSR